MAETPSNMNPDPNKQVLLTRIYVKDCSFESPRTPAIFSTPVSPEVKVSMRTASNRQDNGDVEVVLSVTAEATAESRSVFLVEVHQAGLFSVRGFGEQELAVILGSYCPSILFPYAREVVSELVLKGGMPSLLLQPVNFDAVFAQSMGQGAAAAG